MDRIKQVFDKFKEKINNFELRHEQIQMIYDTYHAMQNDMKAGIHAPTGTGKSLAYLIAYIAVKLDNTNFKITISTFTISLQEQLRKDIEMANEIYTSILIDEKREIKPLNYIIIKGKNNYFCKKNFITSSEENSISSVSSDLINRELKILEKNHSNLDKQSFGMKISNTDWEFVQVEKCESFNCENKQTCTYFNHYFANDVDIYITNHSLFFKRNFYVGEWDVDFNIFDESHKLEKVLIESQTFELSWEKIEKWVRFGVNLLYKYNIPQEIINNWIQLFLYKHETIYTFKKGINVILDKFENTSSQKKTIFMDSIYEDLNFSLEGFKTLVFNLIEWQKSMYDSISFDFIKQNLNTYDTQNVEINEKTEEKFKEDKSNWLQNLYELKEFNDLLINKDNTGLLWVEKSKREEIILKVSPKDITKMNSPFNKGLLLTSGTLAINKSCKPLSDRLNINLDIDTVLPTPFPLHKQTIAYLSKEIKPDTPNYESMLEKEILTLLSYGTFKTFILFNSMDLAEKLHNKLENKIYDLCLKNNYNVDIWLQNEHNHQMIMNSFRDNNKKSILFGTLTYFEGIDLKGESLTQIILTRLPYSRPNQPVQKILDSKQNYSKWEALIRYEQAFGRLIRTYSDFGSFSILDNRVFNHKEFIDVLQNDNIPITSNLEDIKNFYLKYK